MKLYYMPGACSLSPHIVAREAGLPVQQVLVGRDKKLPDGGDYRALNPKGYVPALQLDDGTVLTEGPAIVQYLADQVPDLALAPPNGSIQRYRLQEWLNFLTSEIHKSFSPLFRPNTPEDYKPIVKENLAGRFGLIEQHLADGRNYLLGEQFSVADAYLFVLLRWAPGQGLDLARWPNLAAYVKRVAARPAVDAALDAEKLKK